jgi:hypothetical protein
MRTDRVPPDPVSAEPTIPFHTTSKWLTGIISLHFSGVNKDATGVSRLVAPRGLAPRGSRLVTRVASLLFTMGGTIAGPCGSTIGMENPPSGDEATGRWRGPG